MPWPDQRLARASRLLIATGTWVRLALRASDVFTAKKPQALTAANAVRAPILKTQPSEAAELEEWSFLRAKKFDRDCWGAP